MRQETGVFDVSFFWYVSTMTVKRCSRGEYNGNEVILWSGAVALDRR